jgi:hypothetical protein
LDNVFPDEIPKQIEYDFIISKNCVNIYATISADTSADTLVNIYNKIKKIIEDTKHTSTNDQLQCTVSPKEDQSLFDIENSFYHLNHVNTEYKILLGIRASSIDVMEKKFHTNTIPLSTKAINSPINTFINTKKVHETYKKTCFMCDQPSLIVNISTCCCSIYYCNSCWNDNVRHSPCVYCYQDINELNAIAFINDDYVLPVSLYTTKIKSIVSHEINATSDNETITNWIKFFQKVQNTNAFSYKLEKIKINN